MQQNPTNNPQAPQTIYHAGGHIVVYPDYKRLVQRSKLKIRPSVDAVLSHAGPLGLKPWSIGPSTLDVDKGDPDQLIQA